MLIEDRLKNDALTNPFSLIGDQLKNSNITGMIYANRMSTNATEKKRTSIGESTTFVEKRTALIGKKNCTDLGNS